jgi:deazaflavin-dependent oxidoreductase (nitroreductase family)
MTRKPPSKLILYLYSHGFAPLLGRLILLLTTTGRKTGLPRVTPLQYELFEDEIYLGSASGLQADWVKNILANPQVQVQIKKRTFTGIARVVTDVGEVADFIAYRWGKHPFMIGLILKLDGVPMPPDRAELEAYASRLALVIINSPRLVDE